MELCMIISNSSMSSRCTSDTRHLAPYREGSITKQPVVQGAHQMPSEAKEVVKRTVPREKPLSVTRRFEPPHLPFLLTRRLVRHFGSIVRSFVVAVGNTGQESPHSCLACRSPAGGGAAS